MSTEHCALNATPALVLFAPAFLAHARTNPAAEAGVTSCAAATLPQGHNVQVLRDYVQSQRRQIHLETDRRNRDIVINVFDVITAEVVRKIPSVDLLVVSSRGI